MKTTVIPRMILTRNFGGDGKSGKAVGGVGLLRLEFTGRLPS
jgi:hypothetical protein